MRAMISLYGHLLALQKLGLLDCVTYFSGISGSTWTMAHLYRDPEWSQRDLEGPISHAREHVAKTLLKEFLPEHLASYRQTLKLREEQGYTVTVADLWGLVLESKLHGQRSANFLHGLQLHRDYCNQRHFSTWADCNLDDTPNQLTPQDPQLCLIDAGCFMNSSCPSLFRPGRQVDLIISFNYNQSLPFKGLQQSEKYSRARGLPFPRVEPSPEDHSQPQECYLFSDPTCPEAPVVLHFPLVNDSFRDHSAPGVRRSPDELKAGQVNLTGAASPYFMYNMTYKNEDFDRLLQLSDYNVQNNQGTILQALRTVLKRRASETRPLGVKT
ncbi:phospholipase A2, group IVD [Mus musculus]|nr:phospholipase A2, group IVD [Mus musculus]